MPEQTKYETRDVSVLGLAGFALGLGVAIFATFLVVAAFYNLFEARNPSSDSPSRIEFQPKMLAPPPRLQTDPAIELKQFRAAEDAKLNSYGWIDRNAGIIRIPIQRAMDLVVQRGLPTRGAGTQNNSGKTAEDMVKERANKK